MTAAGRACRHPFAECTQREYPDPPYWCRCPDCGASWPEAPTVEEAIRAAFRACAGLSWMWRGGVMVRREELEETEEIERLMREPPAGTRLLRGRRL